MSGKSSGLVGHGRLARGGWKSVAWHGRPRPTGEGPSHLPGAKLALLPAKPDASPGRFRRVRAFGDRTPPSPTQAGGITRQARQGLVRPAFAVMPLVLADGRPGQDCGSNAAGGRPAGRPTVPAIRAGKTLGQIHLDPAGSPRWPGCCFASFRPAGTAPANRNSPPPAGPGSVSPGHPFRTEGGVVWHGWRGCGKKWGAFCRL